MRRIKAILIAMLAVMAVGAVGASAASAGTISGHISASAWLGEEDCDFLIDYTGGPPPATLTLKGDTFRGDPASDNPCSNEDLEISDITVNFSGSTATLGSFTISKSVCTFSVPSGTTLTDGGGGVYAGGGTASGSPNWLCGSATVNLSNVQF